MSKVIDNQTITVDGYAAGANQTEEHRSATTAALPGGLRLSPAPPPGPAPWPDDESDRDQRPHSRLSRPWAGKGARLSSTD
jgi:hypothetical protein